MGLGIHGGAAAAAAVVAVVAVLFHHHHWWPRFTSWLFGSAAMLATIAVTVWLDALAGLTSTGTGITVLISLVIVFGALCYRHMDRRKHHPVWSSAIFIVAGVLIVVTVGSFRIILAGMGRSVKGSGTALGTAITQVNSGHAAHAISSSQSRDILVTAFVALAALIGFARVHHRRNTGTGRRAAGSGPRAITSGPQPGHGAGNTPAVPAKRG